MEDYSEDFKDKSFPCPTCRDFIPIKVTSKEAEGKNRTPYIMCERCGLHMFVKYDKGIERLKRLINIF